MGTIPQGITMWNYFDPKFDYEEQFSDADSAWTGHKNFIYDYIRNIKPKTIVELGTHTGTSFFSMCQAAKDAKLSTRLSAVDTWKGDKHTAYYGESVFNRVVAIKNKFYPNQKITLLRCFFDEAVPKFRDHSIDLLHVDGLHTYEAVKHDLIQWLNKVSKNGVIVFHDIAEKKDDFGVYILWAELKKKYDTIEFYHSHGLGILFLKSDSKIRYKIFETIWQKYYALLADNRFNKIQIHRLQNEIHACNRDLNLTKLQLTSINENLKRILKLIKLKITTKIVQLTPSFLMQFITNIQKMVREPNKRT